MFFVGMDIGQRQDFTALAVVERREVYRGVGASTFHSAAVRHVERMALGTPYPEVVGRVAEIVGSRALAGDCCLTVDATGVGAPVVDMLRAARLGCEITAVTITGGERMNQHATGWNVPKQDLMAGVQVLLERRELKIARDLTGARMLMRELQDVQTRGRRDGGMRAGAEGVGQHDDLAIALALACWKLKQKRYLNGGMVRLPGM
jgi:hypothetical protein